MRAVAPPDEHIGVVEQGVGKPLFRHVERDGAQFEVIRLKSSFQAVVDAVRINLPDVIAEFAFAPFMNELIPDGYFDLFHDSVFLI